MMPKAAEAPKAAPKAAKAAPKAAKAPPKAPKSSRDFAPDLPKYVALLVASKLAETTKVQYESRLGKLVDATGRPVAWTLGHCVESWASLRQVYGAENYRTLRTFVNLALSMLSHHAEQAGMPASAAREAHACWTKLYAVVSPLALEHYETNEPTEKMKGSHVPWAELERVRDRLIKDRPLAMDTLMLIKDALRAGRRLWRPGYRYAKAGIVLIDLVPAKKAPETLVMSRHALASTGSQLQRLPAAP